MMAEDDSENLAAIVTAVNAVLSGPMNHVGHAQELAPLLAVTQARAVGCWSHVDGHLELAGFLAVDEMPANVQAEFVAATGRVPLTQTQFGIIQAVTIGGPAVNHRAVNPDTTSAGSIGWLGRFEAASSLAIPFYRGSELQGALAVATRDRIEPDDAVWHLVVDLADQLSHPAR
jgi:hypothetical protein